LKATTYIELVQTVMQMDRASKLHGSMFEGMNIQGATGINARSSSDIESIRSNFTVKQMLLGDCRLDCVNGQK
jgi:hypothetical protein